MNSADLFNKYELIPHVYDEMYKTDQIRTAYKNIYEVLSRISGEELEKNRN